MENQQVGVMAFTKRPYGTLTARKGDAGSKIIVLRDSQAYGKTNGIYVSDNTESALKTLGATLEANMDGVINKIHSGEGVFEDKDRVIPTDTVGDSSTKVFKVGFSDYKESCRIVIPWFKGSTSTVAAAIKGLAYAKQDGTKITADKVGVEETY